MDMKIKICGLTNLEDAQFAVDAGADLLGFILYSRSPRYINKGRLRSVVENLKTDKRNILKIGVFVNESVENMLDIIRACRLDAVQLHGEESHEIFIQREPETNAPLAGRAYKAIKPPSLEEAQVQAREYALDEKNRMNGSLPAILLDTYHPDMRGGTGKTGDWGISAELAKNYPLLLAGGLNPGNVMDAVQAVKPWGIDVSSGVEESPGVKNHREVEKIISKVKL